MLDQKPVFGRISARTCPELAKILSPLIVIKQIKSLFYP
jgi:hypothetical protein